MSGRLAHHIGRALTIASLVACMALPASTATPTSRAGQQGGAPVRDRKRTFRAEVRSWMEIRRSNVVMQQRDYSCGAAALATVLQYHLHDQTATELSLLKDIVQMLTVEEMKERIENGLSMTDLRRLAVKRGYLSTSVRLTIDKLQESKVPLIVGIVINGFDHFVVYRGTDGKYVYLADPARGNVRTPIEEFQQQWQKNAALVVINPKTKGDAISYYMVSPYEASLGTLNRYYLRDRVTTKVFPR